MLSHHILLLMQDFLYYHEFKSLSQAYNIGIPEQHELIYRYCKLDLDNKLEYLLNRLDVSERYQCCKIALEYDAHKCINMLIDRDLDRIICSIIYDNNMIDIFNNLKLNIRLEFYATVPLTRNNLVLEGLIELYSIGKIYRPSVIQELEQLGRYDLIDKIKHVYY